MELDFEAPFTDNYINKNPGAGTLKEIKKLKSLNPVYNYQLKNVFLLTKFGVVITENGFPLRDSVTSDMHLKNGMKEIYTAGFMEKDAIELEGSYVSLLGDWSYNFYH